MKKRLPQLLSPLIGRWVPLGYACYTVKEEWHWYISVSGILSHEKDSMQSRGSLRTTKTLDKGKLGLQI